VGSHRPRTHARGLADAHPSQSGPYATALVLCGARWRNAVHRMWWAVMGRLCRGVFLH
jgi:hypothetical protein